MSNNSKKQKTHFMKQISRHPTNERGCLSDGTILVFGLGGATVYFGFKALVYGLFILVASGKLLKLETPLTYKQCFSLGLFRSIVGILFYWPIRLLLKEYEHSNLFIHALANLISAAPAWVLIYFSIRRIGKPANEYGYLLFVLLGTSLSFVINHLVGMLFP